MLDGWLTPTFPLGIKKDGSNRGTLVMAICETIMVAPNVKSMVEPERVVLDGEIMPNVGHVQKVTWW